MSFLTPKKESWLLFELESLQVYTMQTVEDWQAGRPYTEVYWKRKNDPNCWGPFPNICNAMNHFTQYIAFEKTRPKDNVIYVDFRLKKRI